VSYTGTDWGLGISGWHEINVQDHGNADYIKLGIQGKVSGGTGTFDMPDVSVALPPHVDREEGNPQIIETGASGKWDEYGVMGENIFAFGNKVYCFYEGWESATGTVAIGLVRTPIYPKK